MKSRNKRTRVVFPFLTRDLIQLKNNREIQGIKQNQNIPAIGSRASGRKCQVKMKGTAPNNSNRRSS